MSSFIIAANAVVPFMIYILFGMIIRKAGLADGPFLTKLNKLLMFRNITGIESGMNFSPGMVVFAVAGLLLLIGLLILVIPRIESEDARRGVMIQAIFRGNYALFSIPLTTSLFGAEGTALSSLMMLVSIPMYNVMAVVVLSLFGGGKVSLWKILKDIAANPLIDGILAGLLFRLLGIRLPAAVSSPIAALAACTTPMALCVLGARMQLPLSLSARRLWASGASSGLFSLSISARRQPYLLFPWRKIWEETGNWRENSLLPQRWLLFSPSFSGLSQLRPWELCEL